MAATPGRWRLLGSCRRPVASIFSFGDAPLFRFDRCAPSGRPGCGDRRRPGTAAGTRLVAADEHGIFSFGGDARLPSARPACSLWLPRSSGWRPPADGLGYWLVAADGGVPFIFLRRTPATRGPGASGQRRRRRQPRRPRLLVDHPGRRPGPSRSATPQPSLPDNDTKRYVTMTSNRTSLASHACICLLGALAPSRRRLQQRGAPPASPASIDHGDDDRRGPVSRPLRRDHPGGTLLAALGSSSRRACAPRRGLTFPDPVVQRNPRARRERQSPRRKLPGTWCRARPPTPTPAASACTSLAARRA